MQTVTRNQLVEKAKELLNNGTVTRVLGIKKGEFSYDLTPAVFTSAEELEKEFEFNGFAAANFSKYLVKLADGEGKILVFLKPCDSYSFNQLLTEHRFNRENVYAVGIECDGFADYKKIEEEFNDGIKSVEFNGEKIEVTTLYDGKKELAFADYMLERCKNCKTKKIAAFDELLTENSDETKNTRFEEVEKLEAMTPDERYAFWRNELSRCIRCNACRDVCPACTCEKCVFNNPDSGVENKAIQNSFEENMFHIIRAFHVAGRCTDCGECSRVCPQHIPLHLLNRKFIKDINSFYGEYQAGAEVGNRAPLVNYTKEDIEPKDAVGRGSEE